MATERVGIEVEVLGYDEAQKQLQTLERSMSGLMGKKSRVQVQARFDELQKNLKALESHKVKLKADMSDVKGKIDTIKADIKRLEAVKLNLEAKGMKSDGITNRIRELKSELASLEANRIDIQTNINQVNQEMSESTAEAHRLLYALKNFKTLNLHDVFNKISAGAAHVGGAMQSLGNAFSRLADPIKMITSGALFGAGFGAIGKITQGLENGFGRYDTMKQYGLMMEQYANASYSVEDSQKALVASVKGLPTGLDEIASMAQRYTLSLNDMEKGTDLAIASNNAFLASMATDSQRYQGMMQLQDLVNGKDLNSREWMSLGSSMGKAINEVGKELGYADDEMGEFRKELYAGNIASQDFLDALIKVGTGEGSVAKLAGNAKLTWNAVFANVGNAFSRMSQGILEEFDALSMKLTGKSLPEFLQTQLDGVDKITESIRNWIKANPEKIMDFINAFRNIDWAGLGKGFVEGIGDILGIIQKIAEFAGGFNLGKVGKFFALSDLFAKFFTIGGGFVKGTRHIGAGFVTGLLWLVRTIGSLGGGGKFAKALGFLAKLKGKFKGAEQAVEGAGNLAGTITKVAPSWQGVASGAVAVAAIPAIAGAVKLLASAFKDLDGVSMKGMLGKIGYMTLAVTMFGGLATGIGALIALPGIGWATAGATGIGTGIIVGISFAVKELSEALKALSEVGEIKPSQIRDVAEAVKEVAPSLVDVADSLKELDGGGTAYTATGKSGNYATIVENVTKLAKALEDLGGAEINIEKVEKAKENLEALKPHIEDLNQTMLDMFGKTQINASTDGTTTTTKILEPKDIESAVGVSGNLKKILDNLKGIIAPLLELSDELDKIPDGFFENLQPKMDELSQFMANIMDYNNGAIGKFGMDVNLYKNVANSMTYFSNALNNMKEAFKALGELSELDTSGINIDDVVGKVKQVIDDLTTNLSGSSQLMLQTAFLKSSIDSIKQSFETLASIGDGGEISFDGIISGFESIGSSADDAKAKVDAVIESLTKLSNKKPKVSITVNNATALARISAVKTALNAIDGTTAHVGISIGRIGGSIGQSVINASGNNRATGGYIQYRAHGGRLYAMRPRGTDTIPAMLSPGEFVQRKRAVDTFGLDFMRRVNSLDIRGAMQSLNARVGRRMGATGTVINNTYNYNNNAKVEQHFSSGDVNYAFRRANRWVGAL